MPAPLTMDPRTWFAVVASVCAGAAFLLVSGLFYAMHLVRQPGYPESTYDASIAMQDNAFLWHDRHCDVLISGDSTANVGIDPRVITAETGMPACNIATTRPVVDALDTLPLDAFLARNPRPKLLVLQFGPETFYRARSRWQHAGAYAPMVMLTRNLPRGYTLATMARHPAETTQFAIYILQHKFFPREADREFLDRDFKRMLAHSDASRGQLDLNLPPQTQCKAPALALYGPVDAAWIRGLRQKYNAQGIDVLVRASPVPACDPQLAQFRRDLRPFVDGDVDANPIGGFLGGDRHTSAEGSRLDSMQLAESIRRHYGARK